jgi:hypothetical protein
MSGRRIALKEQNLCVGCHVNQRRQNGIYCENCLEQQRLERQNNKAEGKCIICAKPVVNGSARCENCIAYAKKLDVKIRKKRRSQGLCTKCGHAVIAPYLKCDLCRSAKTKAWSKLTNRRLEDGLCIDCGKISIKDNRLCEICYLKKTACKRIGDTSKWNELKLIFENQKALCPYSGQKLVIGWNADLDHKVPTANGGSNDLNNLQWVYSPINIMKWHWSEAEFFDLVSKVYEYCIQKVQS